MINFAEKDKMTPKERLMGLISGKPIDRVPFNPFSLGFSDLDMSTMFATLLTLGVPATT